MPMRLLVIEDDETQRELFVALLEAEGLECDDAGSLAQARARLRLSDYPLVVSDYHLPDGFSLELLESGEVEPHRFILVSGHTAIDRPAQVPFFQKPIDIDVFVAHLRHQLGELVGEVVPERPARRPAAEADDDDAAEGVELALYVAPRSVSSRLARERLMRVLEKFETRALTVELVDVSAHPLTEAGERILFTPTLVCRRPQPASMLVGDLRDESALIGLLKNAGLQLRSARDHQERT